MNHLAEELNQQLRSSVAGRLLSALGRRMYFPKGIIAQSAEAKKSAKTANATIGMAYHDGKPMMLSALRDNLPRLSEAETVAYAPTAGNEQVRELWQQLLLTKNPSLKRDYISLPVVVPGITAGLSYAADLFLDKDQRLITSEPCWDNYSLIFEERREARLRGVRFLNSRGLDLDMIRAAIEDEAADGGAVRILLNFPNNPAGYAPSQREADALCECLLGVAERGIDVLALCDDAYFGLFYEEDTSKESIFSRLSSLHERILAVKIDGPTKEDYVWGLRAAMLTFGSKGLEPAWGNALIGKLMGAIRSSVSCSNTPAQSLLLAAYADPRTAGEKEQYKLILQRRYHAVREITEAHSGHPVLQALPFNAGYFMSFECTGIDAEALRQTLLTKHGIGTVSLGAKYLRLAFSSLSEEQIKPVLETVYEAAAALR